MYSQATVARSTFKDNQEYYSPFPRMPDTSEDDFDISSPIIEDFNMQSADSTSSANQRVDLNADTNSQDEIKSKTSIKNANSFQTEQNDSVSANTDSIPPKVATVGARTIKDATKSMPKTSTARISGLDLEKRKEILSSFQPKV